MAKVDKPTNECPKCGSNDSWQGPRYMPASIVESRDPRVPPVNAPESLIYSCGGCGFQIAQPTKEASEQP